MKRICLSLSATVAASLALATGPAPASPQWAWPPRMDLGVEYRLMNGYGGTGEYDLVLSVRNRGPASARFVRFDLRLTHATALWTYASSRRCSTWPEGWNSTARCWIGTLRPGQQTTVSIRLRKSPLSSSFVYEAAVVGLGSESKPDDNVLVDEIDWF